MLVRISGAGVLLLTFSLIAMAGTIPHDPDIALDPGAASMPLTKGTNFAQGQPTDYFNPFPDIITALTFDLTMNSGLTCNSVAKGLDCGSAGSFHCQTGYYVDCGFTYTSLTGDLSINFSGTNPWDGDPTDSLVGKMEGIPPLLPGCLANPDVKGCDVVGHFIIGLSGWSQAESPELFTGTPTFTVAQLSLSPEPASDVLIGSVLLLGAGLAGIRRRRRRLR